MRVALLVLLLWPLLALRAEAASVTQVIDGDTLIVRNRHKEPQRIRLYGIDCPEKGQAWGKEATETTRRITSQKTLKVDALYQDRYGRVVAIIYLPEGKAVQEFLLEDGAAWLAPRYCRRPECKEWLQLEQKARRVGRGLWNNPQAVPPWEWRKRKQ